mmetsp:Transcript_121894/g.351961  ORF Transcript_121894/g.351961 Transcript_121894/m.351961 type:complete len:204 (+) Transcript_121894:107-718(+)
MRRLRVLQDPSPPKGRSPSRPIGPCDSSARCVFGAQGLAGGGCRRDVGDGRGHCQSGQGRRPEREMQRPEADSLALRCEGVAGGVGQGPHPRRGLRRQVGHRARAVHAVRTCRGGAPCHGARDVRSAHEAVQRVLGAVAAGAVVRKFALLGVADDSYRMHVQDLQGWRDRDSAGHARQRALHDPCRFCVRLRRDAGRRRPQQM